MMKKNIKILFFVALCIVTEGYFSLVFANGIPDLKTVNDCSGPGVNTFSRGEKVMGQGSNFDTGSNYYFDIVKANDPGKGQTLKVGSFKLGPENNFCNTFWDSAQCARGDINSEYILTVSKEVTGGFNTVGSVNFFVNCGSSVHLAIVSSPVPTPSQTPAHSPSPSPNEATGSGATKGATPETGVGELSIAGMLSAGSFGLVLSRFKRGKATMPKKQDSGQIVFGLFNEKNSKNKGI